MRLLQEGWHSAGVSPSGSLPMHPFHQPPPPSPAALTPTRPRHTIEIAMTITLVLAKVIGPLLMLRGLSLIVDRPHFQAMLRGLDQEVSTVSFSMIPVALFAAGALLVTAGADSSSATGILFQVMAWGMMLKASALILFPRLVVKKAQMLGQAGFLNVVCAMTLAVGGYLSWVGYLS